MDPAELDENTSPPSVADRSILDIINPQDHATVYARAEARWYDFIDHDETDVDGDLVIGSLFLEGRWKARGA